MIQIPREENAEAGTLVNLGSVANIIDSGNNFVVHIFLSTIYQNKDKVNLTSDWHYEFIDYL